MITMHRSADCSSNSRAANHLCLLSVHPQSNPPSRPLGNVAATVRFGWQCRNRSSQFVGSCSPVDDGTDSVGEGTRFDDFSMHEPSRAIESIGKGKSVVIHTNAATRVDASVSHDIGIKLGRIPSRNSLCHAVAPGYCRRGRYFRASRGGAGDRINGDDRRADAWRAALAVSARRGSRRIESR